MNPRSNPKAAAATVGALLAEARALGVARLDVQLLLAQVLARPRAWLLAHEEAALDAAQAIEARALLARRADGVPLAYLSGTREFRGLALQVTPSVLVPRPETEALVDWALDVLEMMEAPAPTDAPAGPARTSEVLDLGTGSGALALALKHARPASVVVGTDASEEALAVAAANGQRLGFDVHWLRGDWWTPVAGRRFDLVVSNPPYIAAGDPHLPALRHEPIGALSPGGDGLDALRTIVAGAPSHLRAGAWLLLEHGHDQGAAVRALLAAAGFEAVQTRRDLAGHERLSGGRLAAAIAR